VALAHRVIEYPKRDSHIVYVGRDFPRLSIQVLPPGVAFGKVCDPFLKAVLAVSLTQYVV